MYQMLGKPNAFPLSIHCLYILHKEIGPFSSIRSSACLIGIFYDTQVGTYKNILYYIILLPINRSHTENISIRPETEYLRIVNELVDKVL